MSMQEPIITPAERESRHDAIVEREDNEHQDNEHPTFTDQQTSSRVNERWSRVQAEFVDDPRKSVSEAHELVGELVQRIVDSFTEERNDLERQWSQGGDVSTEELRVCLQRYRAFFSRLLPTVNGAR